MPFSPPLEARALVDHRGGMRTVSGPSSSARLVVFVPAAFTPVCADEVGELGGAVRELRSSGVHPEPEVLLVSTDAVASLRAWVAELGVDDVLSACSDFWPHGEVARLFGAFDASSGTAMRRSFAVRRDGAHALVADTPAGVARTRGDHERALHLLAEGL